MPWTGLQRVLALKLTGSIPWLVIVPILAVVLEIINEWLNVPIRLSYPLALMFVFALVFFIAHVAYQIWCPADLKGIGSIDDWTRFTAKKRQNILKGLEEDKALQDRLLEHLDTRITSSLANVRGRNAFSADQIEVVKYRFREEVQKSTKLLGEKISSITSTSVATFNDQNIERAAARWFCTGLVAVSFLVLLIQIILRLVSVYHVTLR